MFSLCKLEHFTREEKIIISDFYLQMSHLEMLVNSSHRSNQLLEGIFLLRDFKECKFRPWLISVSQITLMKYTLYKNTRLLFDRIIRKRLSLELCRKI